MTPTNNPLDVNSSQTDADHLSSRHSRGEIGLIRFFAYLSFFLGIIGGLAAMGGSLPLALGIVIGACLLGALLLVIAGMAEDLLDIRNNLRHRQ
jgi:hypothetical protein